MTTKDAIFAAARQTFAKAGYDGLRMRSLASLVGLPLSVIYHHYPSKDGLLDEVFHRTNAELGEARRQLPEASTATEELRQRIRFQFAHAEQVVAVLKYYLHFRQNFPKREDGYLPEKSALHIEEVLKRGIAAGEFQVPDLLATAKVIAHAINGYLLEYYPASVGEEDLGVLVRDIGDFILRALRPQELSPSLIK